MIMAAAPTTTHTEMMTAGREMCCQLTSHDGCVTTWITLTEESFVFLDCWGDIRTTSILSFGGPRLGGGRVGEGGCSVGELAVT